MVALIRSLRIFVFMAGGLSMAGCVLLNPYVEGDRSKYNTAPTIQNALHYAQSTRAVYRKAISRHSQLNVTSGLIVAGAATAAAVAALSGVSNEALMRIGIGGASVYAVNGFLYNPARQQIYTAGAKSLTCGAAVFEPLRPVDFESLKTNVGTLQKELPVLQVNINAARAALLVPQVPDKLVQVEKFFAAGNATLQRGITVLQAPGTLTSFVDGVNDEVTAALQKAEPDVAALVNSLGTAIPTNAGLIASLPAPAAPGTKASLDEPLNTLVNNAENQAKKVKQAADIVEILLAGVGTPQSSSLAACKEFLQIGPFRVFPQPSVIVDTTGSEPSADVLITGGTAPYSYAWLGQTPPAGVTLSEQANAAGLTIQVKAPQGVTGTYQLLVQDKGGNSAALLVAFVGGTVGASVPTAVSPAPTQVPQSNPKVSQIQDGLIRLNCLADIADNGDSNNDGVWGDLTTSAYSAFAQVALGGPDAAENTIGKFGDPEFFDRLITAINDTINGGTISCNAAGDVT